MVTELVRIIEGGIEGNQKKISNFAMALADSMAAKGDVKSADRIRSTLSKLNKTRATLDGFTGLPVDSESRMDIAEITYPELKRDDYVFSPCLEEAVENFIRTYKNSDLLLQSGIDLSHTLLLYGPPGCGKTSIANIIASQLNMPLVTAKLDGMVSSLLGSTAKNIRKLFEYASEQKCILFLDEFDVVAKLRDDNNELGELKRVVNSLLQNIDEFSCDNILIAATNHQNMLDPAVWRRFANTYEVGLPNEEEVARLLHGMTYRIPVESLQSAKHEARIIQTLIGQKFSHSAIATIYKAAVKNAILKGLNSVSHCSLLREVYLYSQHRIENEDGYIRFMLANGVTHVQLHEETGISLRSIRNVSSMMNNKEV